MHWFKRRIDFILLLILITLFILSAQAVYADPAAPEGINTFTVAPDPQAPGGNVSIEINVDIAAGVDGITYLCLYEPDTNAPSTNPTSFILTYYDGWNTGNVTFDETAQASPEPSCPDRTDRGQTSVMYKSDAVALPATVATYEGSVTWPIYINATPGTYNWTLNAPEADGRPQLLSDSHTIAAPTAVQLQSASVTTGHYTTLIFLSIFLLTGTAIVIRRRFV